MWHRSYVNYIILAWMLGMRNTCQPLRKKFPDLEAIEEAGIDWLIKPLLLFYQNEILDWISRVWLQAIYWNMKKRYCIELKHKMAPLRCVCKSRTGPCYSSGKAAMPAISKILPTLLVFSSLFWLSKNLAPAFWSFSQHRFHSLLFRFSLIHSSKITHTFITFIWLVSANNMQLLYVYNQEYYLYLFTLNQI